MKCEKIEQFQIKIKNLEEIMQEIGRNRKSVGTDYTMETIQTVKSVGSYF